MRRTSLVAAILIVFSLPGFSQVANQIHNQIENPKLDIFGGYSHIGNYGVGLNGWIASADWHLYRFLGVEGDISGGYGNQSIEAGAVLPNLPNGVGSRMHNFDFGPVGTYRAPDGRFNAFGHLLFGFSHTNLNSAGESAGDTAFSWVLGGGGDYNFNPVWAARAQVDLVHTNFFNTGQNHGRISLGIVYRFGHTD